MDWAKNKVFEWNSSTQTFQMYDKPEPFKVVEIKEHTLFQDYSDDQLISLGAPKDILEFIRAIKSLEDLEKAINNLPKDVYEYLYYLAGGIPFEEILEEIESGKSDKDEERSLNAQKHVYILTEDHELESILSGDFEKWKLFLHPSQRTLAYNDFNGAMKITGGAGTGKTVCALHRAKYLLGKVDAFDKPILFTTYTTSLTKYLNSVAAGMDLDSSFVKIQNFDKLIREIAIDPAYSIINKNEGLIHSNQELELWREVIEYNPSRFDENFLQEEYNTVILPNEVVSRDQYYKTSRTGRNVRIGRKDKSEIWELILEFKKTKGANFTKLELIQKLINFFSTSDKKPFSSLICDEVQDFSNMELTLMRELVEERQNDLFFVGDPYQNIYGRRINFSSCGINVRGRRSRKLKVNYRTTEEIKKKAVHVIEGEVFENFDGGEEARSGYVSLMHGLEPSYQTFDSPEKEDTYILEKLKLLLDKEVFSPDEILFIR